MIPFRLATQFLVKGLVAVALVVVASQDAPAARLSCSEYECSWDNYCFFEDSYVVYDEDHIFECHCNVSDDPGDCQMEKL